MFVLLNRIVLQPLSFPQSDRLVVVKHSAPGLNLDEVGLSSGLYFHYSQHAQSVESLAVYTDTVQSLRVPEAGTARVHVTFAGAALFQVLRVEPALGRLFTEADGRPGFMNMRWTIRYIWRTISGPATSAATRASSGASSLSTTTHAEWWACCRRDSRFRIGARRSGCCWNHRGARRILRGVRLECSGEAPSRATAAAARRTRAHPAAGRRHLQGCDAGEAAPKSGFHLS